ncbi:MAG: hypothetical protein NZ930_02750 [Candidatus Bipolaricaulota bacterium]|nr:hypothetical protein [Candidatus Bipolaricaulota bacterium]MDW8030793.1 hypothetical protein [Candidatus Bipolaricaulota bacterium]
MKRWLIGVLCIGLVALWSPAYGQPKSSDFFMEQFVFGLLGGFLGGPTVELMYVTTLCREAPDPNLCHGLGFAAMQIVVYTLTLPLGASVGIIADGFWRGVVSDPLDWFFIYLYAMVGSWSGWLHAAGMVKVSELLVDTFGWDLNITAIYTVTRVSLPILYAALFGTLGFHWQLPLFSARF